MPERRLQRTREVYEWWSDDPLYLKYVKPVLEMMQDTPKGRRLRAEYEARLKEMPPLGPDRASLDAVVASPMIVCGDTELEVGRIYRTSQLADSRGEWQQAVFQVLAPSTRDEYEAYVREVCGIRALEPKRFYYRVSVD